MIDRIQILSKNFLSRFLPIIICITVSVLITARFLTSLEFIDSLFVCIILSSAFFLLHKYILKIFDMPILSYVMVQMMFFWVILNEFTIKILHFSFKPQAIVFGLSIIFGLIYFIKYFNFLWKHKIFRLITIFFTINIFYFLFYHSDFKISQSGLVYGWTDITEDTAASTIVFIDSIAVFVSSIISLALFSKIKTADKVKTLLINLTKIFSIFTLGIILCAIFVGCKGDGYQVYFPIYLFIVLGLKYFLDNNENISPKYNYYLIVIICTMFGMSILSCNKSSLVAFAFTLMTFMLINYKNSIKINLGELIKDKKFGPIIFIALFSIFLFILIKINVFQIISTKIHDISVANTGISSMYVRKTNWHYFMENWQNKLDLKTAIFGFGTGMSRQLSFYISTMMYSKDYMVQTTHNQYMEMFFDYGAMALFYYLPLIFILIQNIKDIMNKKMDKNVKLFSNLSLVILLYYFIYHLTDGLRVPTAIIIFATIFFLEGLNTIYKKNLDV